MSVAAPSLLAVTWIAPVAGAVLGASILAPLLALWFLKLRRKKRTIPSTLLWTRSLADLRANAPFQRLRPNLLLFLQILCVLAIAFALAQPEAEGLGSSGGRHVLLIDRSASMNAIEVGDDGKERSRLDLAKDAAKARVRELLGGGWFSSTASDVMIVAYGARAEIRAPFTESIATLERAIDAIAPSDESTRLGEALELARAFTESLNLNDAPDQQSDVAVGVGATIELYSDGRISDLGSISLREGEGIVYHQVGEAAANLGVGTVSAERPPDAPDRIAVFASLVNPRPEPARATVQLAVDGRVRAVTPEPIEIPGASEVGGVFAPGRAQVLFRPIEQAANAAIEVAIVEDDALRADDAALAVVPPAKRLSLAHVGGDSFLVRTVLEGLPVERFVSISLADFDERAKSGGLAGFDVVVFDGVAPKELPVGRYLFLGATPPLPGITAYGTHEGVYPRLVRDEHPLFRSASFDELFVSKMIAVQADRGFSVLVEAAEGPIVTTYDRGEMHAVVVGFDPLDSNWPFQRSFVNFIANAVEHLGRAGDSVTGRPLVPGEAIAMRLPAGSSKVEIEIPGGATAPITPSADGSISWGPVTRAGLHRIRFDPPGGGERDVRLVAVNLSDDLESRIDPLPALDLGTRSVQGITVGASRRGALWPWILLGGLALLLVEWWYYQRQVRL